MNKQVKGLLRGVRYISNIFEEEKEQEMQIAPALWLQVIVNTHTRRVNTLRCLWLWVNCSGFNRGLIAAASSSLFRDGIRCGGCFQIRCKNTQLCIDVIITDLVNTNHTNFVLSYPAFAAMARNGLAQELSNLGTVVIEYKKVPYDYKVWSTSQVPTGPLQFRLVVTGCYDGKWVCAQKDV